MRNNEILVIFEKIDFPSGEVKKLPTVPFEMGKMQKIPNNLDNILEDIEKEYEELLNSCRNLLTTPATDPKQNQMISSYASSFIDKAARKGIKFKDLASSLSEDLNLDFNRTVELFRRAPYIKNLINYFAKEYRKSNKEDPKEYIKTCKELVDLIGNYQGVKMALSHKRVGIGESTLDALCKVASNQELLQYVSERKIHLTLAFEMLPLIGSHLQIKEIVRDISGLSYTAAKAKLKLIKAPLNKMEI